MTRGLRMTRGLWQLPGCCGQSHGLPPLVFGDIAAPRRSWDEGLWRSLPCAPARAEHLSCLGRCKSMGSRLLNTWSKSLLFAAVPAAAPQPHGAGMCVNTWVVHASSQAPGSPCICLAGSYCGSLVSLSCGKAGDCPAPSTSSLGITGVHT